MSLPMKKSKIICTIGPSSQTQEVLRKMIANGMNVARINFAHGDYDSHRKTIANIRAASEAEEKRVAIMGDLPGPKMRIGKLAKEPIELERGQSFTLLTDDIIGDNQRVSLSFPGLSKVVHPGDKIYINDGFVQLKVEKVEAKEVHTRVMAGGELLSHKGVNFPDIDLGISAFTDDDHEFLRFAAEEKLDAISQSFVQSPEDIIAVRQAAKALDYYPFIIAKIERSRAVEELEAILEQTDGIMVARGDLGVEIPIEEIALVQKQTISKANLLGKPVITATHMLESMVSHSRPTRAEATDVANAILDGTDCVMLSEETAMGCFPAESVAVMTRIAQVTEAHPAIHDVAKMLENARSSGEISTADLISLSIFMTVEAIDPIMVVTPTLSGATARRVCRFRPEPWIIAVSPNQSTCQNLQFSFGVCPVYETERPANWEAYTRSWLAKEGITEGLVVLTEGHTTADTGGTNHIVIVDLREPQSERRIW